MFQMSRESKKNKIDRISKIVRLLKKEYPDSKCSLIYNNPFQLLVATILSAQCTDERVNKVTSKIFPKYPNAKAFSSLSEEKIGEMIYSTGFFNNKAKNIKGMSDIVSGIYNGEIPSRIEELTKLPGVAARPKVNIPLCLPPPLCSVGPLGNLIAPVELTVVIPASTVPC